MCIVDLPTDIHSWISSFWVIAIQAVVLPKSLSERLKVAVENGMSPQPATTSTFSSVIKTRQVKLRSSVLSRTPSDITMLAKTNRRQLKGRSVRTEILSISATIRSFGFEDPLIDKGGSMSILLASQFQD